VDRRSGTPGPRSADSAGEVVRDDAAGKAAEPGHAISPRDVLLMARPQFWLLSVAAMQPGFVLATHRILPRGPEQLIMAHAFLVAGPLLWLAVLAVNDAYDLAGDLDNPRKPARHWSGGTSRRGEPWSSASWPAWWRCSRQCRSVPSSPSARR
jgi:hypothetical protein